METQNTQCAMEPPISPAMHGQAGAGFADDAMAAIDSVVDKLTPMTDVTPQLARRYAYHALIQMINAAQLSGVTYDEYYAERGDELREVLAGAGVSWQDVASVAGTVGDTAAIAGLGAAATGIGATATPLLEGVAAGAKGVEFVASMLGSGTELDDALRGLYAAAQHIAKREKMAPAQVAAAVRNLKGAPNVRANRGLVANTQLADKNYVAALEHTLLAQRELPRRRAGQPGRLQAQAERPRSAVPYYRGTRRATNGQ